MFPRSSILHVISSISRPLRRYTNLKFGFASVSSRSLDDVLEGIRRAEDLGFDSAWISDLALDRDVFVTMTISALNTTRIRLGTGVTNPYSRHPVVTAAALATINEISHDRVIVGLGVGSKRNLLHPLGLVRTDLDQTCREVITVMRDLLSGREVTSKIGVCRLSKVKFSFSTKKIPIFLAGRGARVLSVAGEVADGAIFSSLTTPRALKYAIDAVNFGLKKAGRDQTSVEKAVYCRFHISNDRTKAKQAILPNIPYRIWDDSYSTLNKLGYDLEVVRRIKRAYNSGNMSEACSLITAQMIDDFAIAGSTKDCKEKVRALKEGGITQLIVIPVANDFSSRMNQLEQFSEEVMPSFR
ncbi:MAG TPA: LLM class flavin-dependent oxidoreductase [Candidatus Hodarchaeales archaeon]|nr:LLM class flavin-dependent oxidoreductase [Candidatus Hodarchaeales archaeon]